MNGPVEYPLACKDKDGWYSDGDYLARGGQLIWMTPRAFLLEVRLLAIDESSQENIDELKNHIINGGKLDPLKLYPNGKEDGRHRAYAAIELGIASVPVISFRNHNDLARTRT